MEPETDNNLSLTDEEIRDKVLFGTRLATDRLIERKQKEDGYLVEWENGKVVTPWARDMIISPKESNAKTP